MESLVENSNEYMFYFFDRKLNIIVFAPNVEESVAVFVLGVVFFRPIRFVLTTSHF